jgi:hypothetical protein
LEAEEAQMAIALKASLEDQRAAAAQAPKVLLADARKTADDKRQRVAAVAAAAKPADREWPRNVQQLAAPLVREDRSLASAPQKPAAVVGKKITIENVFGKKKSPAPSFKADKEDFPELGAQAQKKTSSKKGNSATKKTRGDAAAAAAWSSPEPASSNEYHRSKDEGSGWDAEAPTVSNGWETDEQQPSSAMQDSMGMGIDRLSISPGMSISSLGSAHAASSRELDSASTTSPKTGGFDKVKSPGYNVQADDMTSMSGLNVNAPEFGKGPSNIGPSSSNSSSQAPPGLSSIGSSSLGSRVGNLSNLSLDQMTSSKLGMDIDDRLQGGAFENTDIDPEKDKWLSDFDSSSILGSTGLGGKTDGGLEQLGGGGFFGIDNLDATTSLEQERLDFAKKNNSDVFEEGPSKLKGESLPSSSEVGGMGSLGGDTGVGFGRIGDLGGSSNSGPMDWGGGFGGGGLGGLGGGSSALAGALQKGGLPSMLGGSSPFGGGGSNAFGESFGSSVGGLGLGLNGSNAFGESLGSSVGFGQAGPGSALGSSLGGGSGLASVAAQTAAATLSSSNAPAVKDVKGMLDVLDLSVLWPKFKDEDITDINTALSMSDDEFKELGCKIGHRVKIKNWLTEYSQTSQMMTGLLN